MKKNDSDVIIIEVATTMLRLIIINKESNKIVATSSVHIDYIKRGIVKDVEALTKSIRTLISDTNKNYLNNIKKVVKRLGFLTTLLRVNMCRGFKRFIFHSFLGKHIPPGSTVSWRAR